MPSDAATLPVAVSVITAEDIAASSARTMQDLLSTQAGIHLLNTSSSTDNAIVDLRGFGMTGASNTSSWWTASSRTPTTCPRPTSAWCRWTGRTHRNRARQRLRAIRRRHHRRRDQHHHPPRLLQGTGHRPRHRHLRQLWPAPV
ncbi:Plug domain-containing protein [Achromobacter xylosoxidans]